MENKKAAIVTGAANGIGQAVAIKFAENNYRVTLVDKEPLTHTINLLNKIQGEALACVGDIADTGFIKQIIDQSVEKWGRIDVLVNNAAWRTIETMRTMNMDTWEQTLKVCLTAPAFLAKWSAEVMERLQIPGGIINISSVTAERAGGNSPAYIAAKGALESLTRELAVTYGRSGIRVLSIKPGHIETNMSKDYADADGTNLSDLMISYMVNVTPLGKGGTPKDIAEAVFWLSSGAAGFITGATLVVDGGFTANLNDYALKHLQFPKEF